MPFLKTGWMIFPPPTSTRRPVTINGSMAAGAVRHSRTSLNGDGFLKSFLYTIEGRVMIGIGMAILEHVFDLHQGWDTEFGNLFLSPAGHGSKTLSNTLDVTA